MGDELTPEQIEALTAERDQLKAALTRQERDSWKAKALEEFELAKEWPALVTGDTEEAMKASAKEVNERLAAMLAKAVESSKPEVEKAAARAAYGTPAAGGGGKPPENRSEFEKALGDVQSYLTGKGQRPTKETFDKVVIEGGGQAILARLLNPNK